MFSSSNNIFGIDISDASVEVLLLNAKKEIKSYGRVELPTGFVVHGKVLEKEKLAAKLKDLFAHTAPNPLLARGEKLTAILSLPESQVFIHSFNIPGNISGDQFFEKVCKESEAVIPFEPHLLYRDVIETPSHSPAPGKAGVKSAVLVAAPKESAQGYIDALALAGVKVAVLDAEPLSLSRALFSENYFERLARENNESVSAMIVDIGAKTTSAHFFNSGGALAFSAATDIGGDNFTETIIQKFSVSESEAERLKRTIGFDYKSAGDKNVIVLQLQADLQKILSKISEAMRYYEKKSGERVAEVILAGGASVIPKLDEYLRLNLERNVKIGDSLASLRNGEILREGNRPPILFANVIGLALRVADKGRGINLLSPSRKEISAKTSSPWKRAAIIGAAILILLLAGFLAYKGYENYSKQSIQNINIPSGDTSPTVPPPTSPDSLSTDTEDTSDPLSTPSGLSATTTDDTLLKEVLILETPTGWLNVREEPNKESAQVHRVFPGDVFPLLEDQDGWYKIRWGEAEEGWISAEYASSSENSSR